MPNNESIELYHCQLISVYKATFPSYFGIGKSVVNGYQVKEFTLRPQKRNQILTKWIRTDYQNPLAEKHLKCNNTLIRNGVGPSHVVHYSHNTK